MSSSPHLANQPAAPKNLTGQVNESPVHDGTRISQAKLVRTFRPGCSSKTPEKELKSQEPLKNDEGCDLQVPPVSGGFTAASSASSAKAAVYLESVKPTPLPIPSGGSPLHKMYDPANMEDPAGKELVKLFSELKTKDLKLSQFLQKNPEFFPPPPQKCTFKIRLFYIYTLIIIGLTIFFVVDPKMATKAAKDLVYLIKLTAKLHWAWRTLLYSALICLHQLFGVPLQTVTVALICFATKQFLYGYIVVVTNCFLCSLLVFFLVRRPIKNYIERSFRDNSFVQVIRAEAGLAPVKVSFLFRFMYLPGMYKNLGLSLSTINFATFIVPAVIEICLSNTINCMVGVMLREGFTNVSPESGDARDKSARERKIVIYFSYIMSGLQVICIIIAVLVTMMKMKKIRYLQKLLEIKLEREKRISQGYIFDFEAQKVAPPQEMEKDSEAMFSPEKTPMLQQIEEHQVQVFKPLDLDQSVVSVSQESPRVPDHEAHDQSSIAGILDGS